MDRKLTAARAKQRDRTFQAWLARTRAALGERFALAPNDLLRDVVYRRLWTSVLTSSFGAQIMIDRRAHV